VIALSTDKAVIPINLYGATKLSAEKIFIAANAYAGGRVIFSVVRYGNVVGSRGSVVPFFLNLKKQKLKEFPITDERMTRFWITLEQGVELVIRSLHEAEGGEVFVPVIPSMKVVDLAKAIEPECGFKMIGVRPGEKINETLISEDEARNTKIYNGLYVILPATVPRENAFKKYDSYPFVPEGFTYRSDKNEKWLSVAELRQIIRGVEIE
jgi:UDP-N-acetylglucosamine 4,6-dehydratase